MKCIEMTCIAYQDALPVKVQMAWKGLRLPVSPIASAIQAHHKLEDVCYVEGLDAIEILEQYDPDSAFWWRRNTAWAEPGYMIQMKDSEGQLLLSDSMPSIAVPAWKAAEGKSVMDFVRSAYGDYSAEDPKNPGIYRFFNGSVRWTAAEAKAIEESPLTRPILFTLANLIAANYVREIMKTSDESEMRRLDAEGHERFEAFHKAALAFDLPVSIEELARPLSLMEFGVRTGYVPITDDGMVTPRDVQDFFQKFFLEGEI